MPIISTSAKPPYYAGSEMDTTAADYQAKKAAYFAKADSMFSFVAEKVPDSYLGHFGAHA